jgi:transcription elongation GreA/GreB family factor
MREEFEKLVTAGKLNKQFIEPLVKLAACGFCSHRGWGFGRITSIDTVFARFNIDFPGKSGHAMDLAFAAQSLVPIPKDHIMARKALDLDGLRQMAAVKHLELIKLVLRSFNNKASLDQIQTALVPDVIGDDWKKWWEAARNEMKRDGHFVIPAKKSEPILFQEQQTKLVDRLLADFRGAKGLKARHTAATEIVKSINDLEDKTGVAKEVVAALNAEIGTHQRTQPSTALEAIFVRDELYAAAGLPPAADELPAQAIWSQDLRLSGLLEALPATKHRKALLSFREANPDKWATVVVGSLNSAPTKLVGELAHLLIAEGQLNLLKDTVARLISQHQASSDLLLWLARERTDSYADILGPEVFRAMLTAIERDQFNEKKSNRLRDFILSDKELIVELIESADLEVIKDLTRALQLSPSFDDMDKRSLLARIVKRYPAMQSLITGEQQRQETYYLVSWTSLERRKDEYAELVQKKIPANSKEIAIARSYGDLRENHEYKAAKEMQKLLMRRKEEIETGLLRARGTDFANPRTDIVSIGTKVSVTELGSQQAEVFKIMGAWDSDPDHDIISYLTPVAQSLIGKKAGESVEFELNGLQKKFRVDTIEAVPAAPAAAPVAS